MARRGRFGRRRTGSANFTALIAQLMREQRAAEDRVMFDAYKNGGLVDGKPVDDKRILEYITKRRDGFATNDPSYDEWNNRYIQYEFSIGEQKIQLQFKQGKVSASAVAAYYRSKLKGIAKDSEFYREVAGRAAQWADAAAGAARGRAQASATKGLRDNLNKLIYKAAEYDALEGALTEYARRIGIITGNQKLADASATDLRAMFDSGIYSGEDRITFDDFRSASLDQYTNLSTQVDIQVELGNQGTEYRSRRDAFLENTLLGLNTVDERQQYEAARASWLDAIETANGDPYAIADANRKYASLLQSTLRNATVETDLDRSDPLFIGALQNEIVAVTTGEANGESVAGLFGESGDLAATAAATKGLLDDMSLLDSGKAYYGQREPGGAFSVIPFDAGVATNPLGLDKSLQPSVATVNGQARVVYLKGQSVTASVITDAAGRPVDPSSLTQEGLDVGLASGELTISNGGNLGYVFVNPYTGSRKYGVLDPATGKMVFTSTNPWSHEPINNGGTLTVFTPDVTRVGTKLQPDAASALDTTKLVDADPLLAETTVAPKDILALINAGTIGVNLTEQDAAEYQADLARREAERQAKLVNRDLGLTDQLGIGRTAPVDKYGTGDIRGALLQGVAAIGNVTQSLFGSPDRLKDDLYTPPPPEPTPPASLPPLPPPGLGPVKPPPPAGHIGTVPPPPRGHIGTVPAPPPPGGDATSVGNATADLIDKITNPPTGGGVKKKK